MPAAVRAPLPRPFVAAIVALHALPLFLFGAALLPEARSYFTSSMLLLVTLSTSVAWMIYAMTLAPMASEAANAMTLAPMATNVAKARAPLLRAGLSQDVEAEFQTWKSSTFAQMQTVVMLVWAAWWQIDLPGLPQRKVYAGPALVPNLLASLFVARAMIPLGQTLELAMAWVAAIGIPIVNTVDFFTNTDPESRFKVIDMEDASGSELWLPYILVGVVLAMEPFSMRTQVGLLGGNGLITAVNNVGRALYTSNWLALGVRLRVVLSMWTGFALMQCVVLSVIKPSWVSRRRKQVDVMEDPEEVVPMTESH